MQEELSFIRKKYHRWNFHLVSINFKPKTTIENTNEEICDIIIFRMAERNVIITLSLFADIREYIINFKKRKFPFSYVVFHSTAATK